jgi:hypothetical protein
MPDYQIVLTKPDDSLVSTQVSTAPSVWDEFLAIQLSPATRRSYAAALKDFFQREMGMWCLQRRSAVFLLSSNMRRSGESWLTGVN